MSFYYLYFRGRKSWCSYLSEIEEHRYGLLPGITYIVGSGTEADIRFADSSMSPNHATFKVMDGKCFITDLGSSKPIHVNNSVVQPHVAIEIKERSFIQLNEESIILKKMPLRAYFSNLGREDDNDIRDFINQLGTVIDEPTDLDAITHVVADGKSCSKHILRAIMGKQYVVKPIFIITLYNCILKCEPLPYARGVYVPNLRPDCTIDFRADRSRLFFGWTALFDTEFDFGNLAEIITLGGGKAVLIYTVPTSAMSIHAKAFCVRPQDCPMSTLMRSVSDEHKEMGARVIVPKEIQEAVFFNDATEFCNPFFQLRIPKPNHIDLGLLHPIPPTKEKRSLLITRYHEIYPLLPPFSARQWNLLRRMGDVQYHVDCFEKQKWFVDLTVEEEPYFKWLEADKLPKYNVDQFFAKGPLTTKQYIWETDFSDDEITRIPLSEVEPGKVACAKQTKTFKRKGREDEDFIAVCVEAREEGQLVNTCPDLTISVFHLGYDVD